MELPSPAALLFLLLPLLLVPAALLARWRRGRRTPPLKVLVVAGSGGHTTEILRLLSCLSESYSPRHYVFADSDKMSEAKIHSFEQKRAEKFPNSQVTCSDPTKKSCSSSGKTTVSVQAECSVEHIRIIHSNGNFPPPFPCLLAKQQYSLDIKKAPAAAIQDQLVVYCKATGNIIFPAHRSPGDKAYVSVTTRWGTALTYWDEAAPAQLFSKFTLDRIPRSREVRQSWTSSVVTTLYSILYSLPLTYRLKPDLVLCNGPGTCVPVCLSALLLGLLGMKKAVIVYVESICRVETLSLSGKILYYFSDYFIVQWPELKEKYPKSIYLGRIV